MPPEIRRLLEETGTSINTLIVADVNNVLGEPWITQLKGIHAQLNATLSSMEPTEQVPAAQQAQWGLSNMRQYMLMIQNTIRELTGIVKSQGAQIVQANNSLPATIDTTIDGKVKAGELFTKASHDSAVLQARKDGEKDGLDRGKLRSDRLLSLNAATLASEVIATIPDAFLVGEQAAFDNAKTAALDRVTKLSGVGIAFNSMGNLPWTSSEVFDAEFARYEQINKAAKGSGTSHNAATPKTVPALGMAGPSSAATAPKPTGSEKKSVAVIC